MVNYKKDKMKKLIFLFYAALTFASCSNNNNDKNKDVQEAEKIMDPIELENESLASGIIDDTLIFDCLFGMSKADLNRRLKEFETQNLIQLNADSSALSFTETPNKMGIYRTTVFEFYSDKLFRTRTYYYPEQVVKKGLKKYDIESELINKIKVNNRLKNPLENGTQASKFYWLHGNKRIDFYDTLGLYIEVNSDMRIEKLIVKNGEQEAKELAKKQREEDEKIEQKLKEIAKRDWPDDYTTQEYWIKEQLEAYEYMKLIPDDNIKRKAQRDWPYDFSTQKYWYNEQVAAKERLK